MSQSKQYSFSTTDGILARFDGAIPDLWRAESGRWEPYYDIYEFAHNSYPIDEADAKKIIGAGELYAPSFYRKAQIEPSHQAAEAAPNAAG